MTEIKTRKRNNSITSFRNFISKQNSISSAISQISEEAFVRLCDNAIFRRTLSGAIPQRDPTSWLFLVGCYNSGTTLLQHLLSAHPEVSGLPREGVRFTNYLSNLELNGHHMIWDDEWQSVAKPGEMESAEVVTQIKRDWLMFWKRNAKIFMDKSVSNTARIEWLDRNFGNTKFIGISRNGYCVAEGLHRRCRPPDWLKEETGLNNYPLVKTASQWAMINEVMLSTIGSTNHFLIRFEDLVSDPVFALSEVFEFLELEQPKMEFKNQELIIARKSFQIFDPNPGSLQRLGDRKQEIMELVSPIMSKLGYDND
ncbi:MAG: sulfotransferase family protein [Rhizobiaceae bacterium]